MSRPVLAVFGGSFDPPHLGHVFVPTYVFSQGLADKVLVAPCWEHPFGKVLSSFSQRLVWTRAAMAVHGPNVEVSDIEARLRIPDAPSHTIRLLDALARECPNLQIRLVVGSDVIARGECSSWLEWDHIETMFPPIVVPRGGFAPADTYALPNVSSTQVRQWLENRGHPEARMRLDGALPHAVRKLVLWPARGSVWLIGHGNVWAHANLWLRERGLDVVTLAARSFEPDEPQTIASLPDGAWIVCPDAALPDLARRLVEAAILPPALPVLHAAGALLSNDPAALGILADAGHPVGTLHPICSLRRERLQRAWLSEASFGIEGHPAARELARKLIGDRPIVHLDVLTKAERYAYHAACSLAANHLAVLETSAVEVLVRQGHDSTIVRRAIATLLRSGLDNLLALGIPDGITGPVARGDHATVDAHVRELDPDVADLYRILSEQLAKLLDRAERDKG